MNKPFHRLPDEISVPLAELRGVVVELDELLDEFRRTGVGRSRQIASIEDRPDDSMGLATSAGARPGGWLR